MANLRLGAAVMVTSIAAGAPVQAGAPPPIPDGLTMVQTPNHQYRLFADWDVNSEHYMSPEQTGNAANALDRTGVFGPGNPTGYHDSFVAMGFQAPWFSSEDRNVFFYDCKIVGDDDTNGCDNGTASSSDIKIPVTVWGTDPEPRIRRVLGHELFHHVEFGYENEDGDRGCGGIGNKTVCEGMARAMDDKSYLDVDMNPAHGSYFGEVNNYLGDPNRNIWTTSYEAALWWTYLMEQYGTAPFEPNRGVDFLVQWWENAVAPGAPTSQIQITNETIKDFAPSHSVTRAFHDFAITNVVKDLNLNNVSASFRQRYSYRDEEPILFFPQPQYDEINFNTSLILPIAGTRDFTINAAGFGVQYIEIGTQYCSSGQTLRFSLDPVLATSEYLGPGTGMFSLIAVQGDSPGRPALLYKNISDGWVQEIVQPANPYERLIVTLTGRYGNIAGTGSIQCIPEPPAPQLPLVNPLDPQTPGLPDTFTYGELPFDIFLPDGMPLRTLDAQQVAVQVGAQPVDVIGAIPTSSGYRLQLRYPPLAAGRHDVTVAVGGATTTVEDAINIGDVASDFFILMDRSATMGGPFDAPRLDSAVAAASLLTDALPDAGQLALGSFWGNDFEPDDDANIDVPFDQTPANRDRVQTALGNYFADPGWLTSIGDGLGAAAAHAESSGAEGQNKFAFLISDGAENEADFWSGVRQDVIDAGIEVHTLALSGQSDQGLLQQIATETGGTYHYADEDDRIGMGAALMHALNSATGRSALFDEERTVTAGATVTARVSIDDSIAGAGHIAVFWDTPNGMDDLRILDPDGQDLVQPTLGRTNPARTSDSHFIIDVDSLKAGTWRFEYTGADPLPPMQVWAQIAVKPDNGLRLAVDVASALTDVSDTTILEGDAVRVNAMVLQGGDALEDVEVRAYITNPDDELQELGLSDTQGTPGDAKVGDRTYSGLYRDTSEGSPTGIPDGAAFAPRVGSYELVVEAVDPRFGTLIQRRAFHVLESAMGTSDGDADGLPDRYEDQQICLDAESENRGDDTDGDGLLDSEELAIGTSPCDSDTDGGGETDGSEVDAGRNPLDPEDDALARIEFAYAETQYSEHIEVDLPAPGTLRLRYDHDKPLAVVTLWRGTSPETLAPYQEIEDGNGVFDDTNVTPGQTYWYRFSGKTADGSEGSPSPLVEVMARDDNVAPQGSINLNDGAARTDDRQVLADLAVYLEAEATAEMAFGINATPGAGWEPFAREKILTLPAVSEPTWMNVAVRYRDAAENESIVYSDVIELYPPGILAAFIGTVVDGVSGTPLNGVRIEPEGESPTMTAAGGQFEVPDLAEDNYWLRLTREGYLPARLGPFTATAGDTVNLGALPLAPVSDLIFANAFEADVGF